MDQEFATNEEPTDQQPSAPPFNMNVIVGYNNMNGKDF